MAPFTSWLPPRTNQEFDLVLKIVGPCATVLLKELTPISQFLTAQGFAVMGQRGRLHGDGGDFVLHLRIASRAFYSMGHGCDMLVYIGDGAPEFSQFNLQPGSVLLWEPPGEPRVHPTLPNGVIAYPIPLTALCVPHAEGLLGKGLAAIGVLLNVLGLSQDALAHVIPLLTAPRSFMAGLDFARRAIEKRDAYSLPSPASDDTHSRTMLTPEQAIMLGFVVSTCDCRSGCAGELIQSPARWVARHAAPAGSMVSVLQSERHPGVQVYRGPQGKVMALLGGDDSAIASCLDGCETPRVFVAADIPDVLRLVMVGQDLVRRKLSDGVGVLIGDTVAVRHQSVEVSSLVGMIREPGLAAQDATTPLRSGSADATVERDGDAEAEVGFMAWGAAQGVVRDAVALCRSFGLRVAGFYPKCLVPFPHKDMESFAQSVGRVVLVESGQTQGYWDRLRATFSFEYLMVTPQPGQSLTPMDIFLREGLGAL